MPPVNIEDITQDVANNTAIVVDVREDYEYRLEHAKDAMQLSVRLIAAGYTPTTDTSKTIYLYCASGSRSSVAAQILKAKGFDAINLGGLHSWKRLGGKTVSH